MLIKEPWRTDVLVNKKNWLHKDYEHFDMIIPKIKFASDTQDKAKLMRKEAAKAIEKMFYMARRQKIDLCGASAYRSYKRQSEIFKKNFQKDGVRANMYSARPGQSEHQTGFAIDITCKNADYELTEEFKYTNEYKWLLKNAHNFGFILRYPEGKELITGYIFEPWHFRYVGKELAKRVFMEQKVLEEVLS